MEMDLIWQIVILAVVLYLGYHYVKLYFKARKIEHEFTSIVNHTFRTPLTRISWISKELEKRDLPREEFLLYLQNLNNSASRLLEIVDLIAGIKDIKDTASYDFRATSFREIVEKSIAKYRDEINRKNITFQISTFRDIPLLTVDLKKITFVIDTLVENAVIYTPKNGKILIDCLKKLNKIVFYVGDSGLGLTKVNQLRLFSRFYRSKRAVLAHPDGMGLRLYLAKQIVLRHRGKIYAKSKGKDQGSVFFLELPINK